VYRIVLSASSALFFEKATTTLQRRLDRCFNTIALDPKRHPNIKPLKGKLAGHYRFRLGDYRIVYRIDENDKVVIVAVVAHRRDVYE
jgi:mRNA interferase RelE/StbE